MTAVVHSRGRNHNLTSPMRTHTKAYKKGLILHLNIGVHVSKHFGLVVYLSLKQETHCMVFGCPRLNIGIMKQPWGFLWSWLLIGGSMSYRERGLKTAVVTDLWAKIAYNIFLTVSEIQFVCCHDPLYWPTNENATWNQCDMALKHKTVYAKLLSLPFFSVHIKTRTAKVWFIMLFLFTTSGCWWRFILL